MPSNTLCPLPWLHRFVHTDGTISVCCMAVGGKARREDGTKIRAEDGASEEEIVNSRSMRDIKAQMMRGEWPDTCSRCQRDESHGGISRRQHALQEYGTRFEEMVAATTPDGASRPATSYFHYAFGNTCNLKCRMCTPAYSSLWIDEYHLVEGRPLLPEEKQKYLGLNWHRAEGAFEPFFEQLAHVERLHLSGGEPLIIPQALALLQRIVDAGEAGHIALSFNTNITKVPERMRTLWPRFKSVHMYCSIDGFGAVNEYIRFPGLWADVDAHMRRLDDEFVDYGLSRLSINCTVQAYNVLRLGELFDYLASGFKNVVPIPMLSPIVYPLYFDVRILPPSLKALAIERLEDAKRVHADGAWKPYAEMISGVDALIHTLGQDVDGVEALRSEFVKVTKALDHARAESLASVVPELAQMLIAQCNECPPIRRLRQRSEIESVDIA